MHANVYVRGEGVNRKSAQVACRFPRNAAIRAAIPSRTTLTNARVCEEGLRNLCITLIIHSVSMYSLNAVSGTPIYRQIVDQTCQLVASGRLPHGELLPSVRALAADLGINPMTVSKAYSLLEREGIVTRRRGLGMVVEETSITPAETIRPEALALVDAARRLRLSRQDVAAAIDLVWNPERKDT